MNAISCAKAGVLLLCAFLVFACHDDDVKDCGVTNPAEELPWLAEKTQAAEQSGEMAKFMYCLQGDYKGQRVFIWANCCPFCNSIFIVYDCSGNELGWLGTAENGIAPDDIKNQSLAWKSSTSVCNF